MCNEKPCKCSVDLIPVENTYEAVAHGPIGAFAFGTVRIDGQDFVQLRVKLPNEGGQYHALPLYQAGQARPRQYAAWEWDGNLKSPTLKPSILTRVPNDAWLNREDDAPCTDQDMVESWHGYIRNGRAVST